MKKQALGWMAGAALMVAGCMAPGAEEDLGVEQLAVTSANGTSLNGTSLNGTSLNGTSLNGTSLNGTSLNGTSLNGTSMSGVTLTATKFTGRNSSGQTITGSGFVGTSWTGTASNGAPVTLRIDSAATLANPNNDVWAYGVSYQTTSGWSQLCGVDGTGATILAVPLSGVWNYQSGVTGGGSWTSSTTSFTWSCRQKTFAKCVELGYKPWKTVNSSALLNYHLACVRLLRADYCGDGTSWTRDGTTINLYDNVVVQADTQAWNLDAEWDQNGARCISPGADTRVQSLFNTRPPCFSRLVVRTCGQTSDFSTGSLEMDEYLQ